MAPWLYPLCVLVQLGQTTTRWGRLCMAPRSLPWCVIAPCGFGFSQGARPHVTPSPASQWCLPSLGWAVSGSLCSEPQPFALLLWSPPHPYLTSCPACLWFSAFRKGQGWGQGQLGLVGVLRPLFLSILMFQSCKRVMKSLGPSHPSSPSVGPIAVDTLQVTDAHRRPAR